uniref:U6 snRNA-associated Sm-like protein LSm1 n=1 Tax=Trichuris muris TaxID=70415 RepID=A0A5S6R000_TRIMR
MVDGIKPQMTDADSEGNEDGSAKVEDTYANLPSLYGAATLLDDLDKRIMVWLRDGRSTIGYLRSTDPFANLVLEDAVERVFVGRNYADIPLGLFIIRGENVLLSAELDPEKSDDEGLCRVSVEELLEMQRQEQLIQKERQETLMQGLKHRGPFSLSDCSNDG